MSEPGIFGRMTQSPNALLFELIYEPGLQEDLQYALPALLKIDAAHIVMLVSRKLVPHEVGAKLLILNEDLAQRLASGEAVFSQSLTSHRGLYMLYENEFINHLGSETGGSAHLARSRNDIQSTITRMRLRTDLADILDDLVSLQREMLSKARFYSKSLMSGFTHLQPSQPTSFGHYLAAVLEEIGRSSEWLSSIYEEVNCSPMGAAAGLGSSFDIDRAQVARLLGFSSVVTNTLDAVASRDYVAKALACFAILGTTLSRLANDLQLWGSSAYNFVDWPDEVMSTSSIMPQKRNAFVMESIRAQSSAPVGALMSILMVLKSSPFSNSVEVSSGIGTHTWTAIAEIRSAVRLMTLLLNKIVVNEDSMRQFTVGKGITMASLAEFLVARYGIAFRRAHDLVSALVSQAQREMVEMTPEWICLQLETLFAKRGLEKLGVLRSEELKSVLEPNECLNRMSQNGGPSPFSAISYLEELERRGDALRSVLENRRINLRTAETDLANASLIIRERVL